MTGDTSSAQFRIELCIEQRDLAGSIKVWCPMNGSSGSGAYDGFATDLFHRRRFRIELA